MTFAVTMVHVSIEPVA